VLVFAGLLAGVYFAQSQKAQKGIREFSLAKVDTDTIDKIVITGPNAVSLEKKGGSWKLEDGHLANEGFVKNLLSAFPMLVSRDVVSESKERFEGYELNEEKGTRVVASAAGKQVADFIVGKRATGGSYVLAEGAAFMVKAVFSYSFSHPKAQWFELALFPGELGDPTKAQLGPKDQPFELSKGAAGWALTEASAQGLPEAFRFDAAAAERRVSSLVKMRAKEIVIPSPDDAITGLSAPLQSFSFTAGEKTYLLRVGKAKEGDANQSYGQVEGSADVLLLYTSSVNELAKSLQSLRDLSLMSFDPAKATSLEIKRKEETLKLEKKDNQWTVASSSLKQPEDFSFDPGLVQARLSALQNARAMGVLEKPASSLGLSKPAISVRVGLEGGESAVLQIGAELDHEGQKWSAAKGNRDAVIYGLSAWMKNNLSGGLLSFKEQPKAPQGKPGFDPAQMQNLPPEIKEALMKRQLEQARLQAAAEAATK